MSRRLRAARTLPAPGPRPCGLAWDGRRLWYSDGTDDRISALASDGRVERSFACPGVRTGLAFADGRLWQVCGDPKEIRVSDVDGALRERIALDPPGDWACGIDVRDDALWVAVKRRAVVETRELRTGRVVRALPGCPDPGDLTLVGDDVWLADHRHGLLLRIDEQSGDRVEYTIGGSPTGLGSDGERLWSADVRRRTIREFTAPRR